MATTIKGTPTNSAGDVVVLDGTGKLPAVDGSQVTGFYASSATTQTGTATTQAVTPKGLADSMIGGNGQTWQVVTGSRALATTYYNTTGRPIYFSVTVNAGNATWSVVIDSITVGGPWSSGYVGAWQLTGLVPPGGSYRISGTAGSLSTWNELR